MLHASQPTVYVHVYVRREPPQRSPNSVARCLFGKPSNNEVRRQLDDELANNYRRFSNRYEVCSPDKRSPSKSSVSSTSLVNKEDPRRKRIDAAIASRSPVSPTEESKRQKLLTEYWPKSRDSCNSRSKSS